ncbi:MAG: hypothetical protein HYS25_07055 [Ignavibacteriales bacterium]|nr:hypothetical protein [Ignavibacteriales bacterium]
MKIGIISNHHFSLPSINYLLNNNLIAGFAVPEVVNQNNHNIKMIADTFHLPIKILQKQNLVENLNGWLSQIKADVIFVFSFPHKIPEAALSIPKYGFINFHPGILPQYRGPDPLFWQIKNGVTETGITAHKIDKNFDSGPIIHIEKEPINHHDTYGFLENKLAVTLLKSVIKILAIINECDSDTLPFIEQEKNSSLYYGRPKETDLIIDWQKQDTLSIQNLVRACNPKYQGAVTYYKNVPVRFLQASFQQANIFSALPGTVIDTNNCLKISCVDNKVLSVDIIYVSEGCYTGSAFQSLFNINVGDRFGWL